MHGSDRRRRGIGRRPESVDLKPVVAHLLPEYNPFPPVFAAGTELRVEQVARRQRRYHPLVLCRGFDAQAAREPFEAMDVRRVHLSRVYVRLFRKLTRLDPWPYAARIWSISQREQARLLHIHNEPKLLAALAGRIRTARARGRPLPIIAHIANRKPFRPQDVDLVTHWACVSRHMADWVKTEYDVARQKISVIYTGADASRLPPHWAVADEERQSLRQKLGLNRDDLAILFAGRIVEEKGVRELLDAFGLLRARIQRPVRLLLAGTLNNSKDPKNRKARYGREMQTRFREPGVRYIGSLEPARMHAFLTAGDLFALPSLWDDPFPTVMLEAAAAGLPILGSRRGGIPEFLENCPGATLLETPDQPETMADALLEWMENPQLREQTGRCLRDKVERNFSWERVTRDFEDLYDRLDAEQVQRTRP